MLRKLQRSEFISYQCTRTWLMFIKKRLCRNETWSTFSFNKGKTHSTPPKQVQLKIVTNYLLNLSYQWSTVENQLKTLLQDKSIVSFARMLTALLIFKACCMISLEKNFLLRDFLMVYCGVLWAKCLQLNCGFAIT